MLLSLVYRLLRCLVGLLAVLIRSDLSKDAELLVLRHENQVMRRQLAVRVRWDHADRLWLAALSRLVGRPGGRARDRRVCGQEGREAWRGRSCCPLPRAAAGSERPACGCEPGCTYQVPGPGRG
jgi:hypothetical protein